MTLIRPLGAVLALGLTLSSPALATRLSGPDIAELVGGKTVVLKTSYGSMPLIYRTNRQVVGDGRGTGLGRFFNPRETGRWWVSGNRLCQKWPSWYDGQTLCFKIDKTGPRSIRWIRQDGYSGTAVIR